MLSNILPRDQILTFTTILCLLVCHLRNTVLCKSKSKTKQNKRSKYLIKLRTYTPKNVGFLHWKKIHFKFWSFFFSFFRHLWKYRFWFDCKFYCGHFKASCDKINQFEIESTQIFDQLTDWIEISRYYFNVNSFKRLIFC